MFHHVDWPSLAGMATFMSIVVPAIVRYLIVPSIKNKLNEMEDSLETKMLAAIAPIQSKVDHLESRLDNHMTGHP